MAQVKLAFIQQHGVFYLLTFKSPSLCGLCPVHPDPMRWPNLTQSKEAQWPIGYGVGLRIKRSSVRIRCTRENAHPRKRAPDHTTPAYTDTEAKFSSQMQPRKCAPTAYLYARARLLAFCTRIAFCTRWSNPVAEF